MERLEARDLLSSTSATTDQLRQAYGQIPLSFEANQGQADAAVRFLARGQGYGLFLTPTDTILTLSRSGSTGGAAASPTTLHIGLVGGNPMPLVRGVDRQEAVSNYFLGNDPGQWHTNVPTYAQVAYQDVYPGIDLVYYGNQQQLEYDFKLSAGADPGRIRMAFTGAESLSLDDAGQLVVHTVGGNLVEHAPVLYQEAGGLRQSVAGRYVLYGRTEVGFQVERYDHTRPLVIDPVLAYSTYLGGSGDGTGYGIAVDASGNAYVTGDTLATNFPTTVGTYQPTSRGAGDAFVSKLNANGTALLYSTYLGGSGADAGTCIVVDRTGNAFVTGFTTSANFPATVGAFQATNRGAGNVFVAKLNATGTALVYSTYLGGSESDRGNAITVDGFGNAFVTGYTTSANFPTTASAFQTTYQGSMDGFVTKLNPSGTALVYSTLLGSSSNDNSSAITVDGTGNAYLTGYASAADFPTTAGAFQTTYRGGFSDAFVTKLNANGTALLYSTYIGGNGQDGGRGIAVDQSGNAYVAGYTASANFPTTAGAFQTRLRGGENAFVTKLNANGTAQLYSTFLGGSSNDEGRGLVVDGSGNVFITGFTPSADFPTTAGAFQTTYGGGYDAFVTELNASGTGLVYSTFLGGTGGEYGNAIAVDGFGHAYITGFTLSANFPITPGAFQTIKQGNQSAFVTQLDLAGANVSQFALTPGSTTPVAGTALSLTVRAQDSGGNTVSGYRGTIHFSSTDPQATLPADYAFTAADAGVHNFTVALKTAGAQTLTVRDTSSGGPVGQASLTVVPAAASRLIVGGFPSPATAGTPGTITVMAKDPFGNTATGYRGTVHFTSSDPQATLPANYLFIAADNGSHTFSVTLKTAGNQTLTATDTANGSLTSTQAGIVVNPAPVSRLVVSGFPSPVTAGTAGTVTVTAKDAYGNTAIGYRGTVQFTSSDLQATLPANYLFIAADNGNHTFGATLKTAGNQALTATDTANGSLTSTQAGIIVTPALVSRLVVSGFPSPVTAGTAGAVTVMAKDPYGNTASGYRGTVHFTSSDPQAVVPVDFIFTTADNGSHTFSATLKTAGNQTITTTDTTNPALTASFSVLVTPAAAALLRVAGFPSPVAAGNPQLLDVTAQDPYGNTAAAYRGTIHFRSSDPQALLAYDYTFTATDSGSQSFAAALVTVGSQTITATDTVNASITGTQSGIVVTTGRPDHIRVVTSVNSTVAGLPFDLAVTMQDRFNNTVTGYTGTVTFSSADPYGAGLPPYYSFQPSDQGVVTFAGGATLYTAGTWDVTVTDTVSGITGAAFVDVLAAPAVAFQVLAPARVVSGTPFELTVVAVDSYGNTDTGYLGTVTFTTSDSDPGVVLPADYTFQSVDAGLVTFPGGVTLITLGDQLLSVTDPVSGLTGAATVSVTAAGGPGSSPGRGAGSEPPASAARRARIALDDWFAARAEERYGRRTWLPEVVPASRRLAACLIDGLLLNEGGWSPLVLKQGDHS